MMHKLNGLDRLALTLLCAGLMLASGGSVLAGDMSDSAMHDHHESTRQLTQSTVSYVAPDVDLVRDDGKAVSLRAELDDGRPVVMNFIFTTCTSICPLASQTFSEFARRLGADRGRVHLVSISVDPEQDTPERLREYAKRFDAGPEWQHYTGTLAASLAAQQAFGVYRGDKMSHMPVTLMRAAPSGTWLRLDGFATPDDLLREYRTLLTAK
jgi:protein SCO1